MRDAERCAECDDTGWVTVGQSYDERQVPCHCAAGQLQADYEAMAAEEQEGNAHG